jgi:8-oxo-dGTP pyrophosphatase MutT (NUDIX family)
MKHWETLASRAVFSHPRVTLVEDTVRLPNGTVTDYLRFGGQSESATVICLKDGKILLSQEYSYPVHATLYQFPGGGVEAGEDPAVGALRELQEETGHTAQKITELGWYYINNRRSDAKMHVYLAESISEVPQQGGDAEEDITSEWVSIETIDQMITRGEITNFSVLAAWALFKQRAGTIN